MCRTAWVQDRDIAFQFSRQQQLAAKGFPRHLVEFVDEHAGHDPVLRFALLAQVIRSDLELSVRQSPSRTAMEYFAVFPELTACPTLIADLLSLEANLRAHTDPEKRLQFIRELPPSYQAVLASYGPPSRYELKESLEMGGQGVVWQAMDRELNRRVAVKTSTQRDDASVRGLLQEACLTSQLEHPVIVPVYGASLDNEQGVCYAMRFVDLDRLDNSIEKLHALAGSEPDSLQALRRMVGQVIAVARAIEYAHKKKVLHLDLKPGNILVGDFGETMLIDWGMARPVSAAGDTKLKTGGTLPYMSPEQASPLVVEGKEATPAVTDHVDERSDIYSLGATLYHILANRPPFVPKPKENRQEFLRRIVAESPPSVRHVAPNADRTLAAIADRAIRRDPSERYQTAEKFAQELEFWQAGEETTARPWSHYERSFRWLLRNRKWVLSIGVVIAIAFLVIYSTGVMWDRFHRRQYLAKTIAQLPSLPPSDVRSAVKEIRAAPAEWARSELISAKKSTRLDLAKLPFEPTLVESLISGLATVSDPSEYGLVVNELLEFLGDSAVMETGRLSLAETGITASEDTVYRPEKKRHVIRLVDQSRMNGLKNLQERLESVRGEAGITPLVRVRAAAAIAAFEPQYKWTSPQHEQLVEDLVRSDPRWYDELTSRIARVQKLADPVIDGLKKRFSDATKPMAERMAAGMCWVRLWKPAKGLSPLWSLVEVSEAEQLPILLEAAERLAGPTGGDLKQRLDGKRQDYLRHVTKAFASEDDQERADQLAAEVANLALAKWSLDPSSFDTSFLQHAPDPRLRTELIHRFQASGFPLSRLLQKVQANGPAGESAALVLAATTYSVAELSDKSRLEALERLEQVLGPEGDPESIAAMERLSREWNLREPRFQPLPTPQDRLGWQWSTGHQRAPNHRLIVIPAAIANAGFEMGAVPGEGFRDLDERPRKVRIPRAFAVSAREVTVGQVREFLEEYGKRGSQQSRFAKLEIERLTDRRFSPREVKDQDAVCMITMAMAAAYCNWLSESEGLAPCYPDGLDLYVGADGEAGTVWHNERMLEQPGYRLPTEVEAEFFLRAGTRTPRSYGFRKAYIRKYAVFRFDDQLGPSPPATRLPNPWGLFDTLGNVAEWCHPLPPESEVDGGGVYVDNAPVPPWEAISDSENGTGRDAPELTGAVLRGGAHNNVVDVLRSAYRLSERWTTRSLDAGFRVVRTLSSHSRPVTAEPQK